MDDEIYNDGEFCAKVTLTDDSFVIMDSRDVELAEVRTVIGNVIDVAGDPKAVLYGKDPEGNYVVIPSRSVFLIKFYNLPEGAIDEG